MENWTHVFIYTKGDKLACQNYRVITVLNVSYKRLSVTLVKQITAYGEDILGECQCGFHPNRSTTDQMFYVIQTWKNVLLFTVFCQAFDNVNHKALYDTSKTSVYRLN
jgi:hypothetical protein